MTLNEQRARLLRILAGTVLMHADDVNDLRAFCSLLSTDPKIGVDVASLLGSTSFLNSSNPLKQIDSGPVQPTNAIDNLFSAVQRRGVSKRECLEAMKQANSRFIVPKGVDKMAVRDLIRKYVSQSTSDQISRLLRIIDSDEVDPYLRGIGKNR